MIEENYRNWRKLLFHLVSAVSDGLDNMGHMGYLVHLEYYSYSGLGFIAVVIAFTIVIELRICRISVLIHDNFGS